MSQEKSKKPIFNAHAHVFTHQDVPPFLARSIVIWPFYYLIHVPTFVRLYIFYRSIKDLVYTANSKKIRRKVYQIKRFLLQNWITFVLYYALLIWLALTAFFILFYAILGSTEPSWITELFQHIGRFLERIHLLFARPNWFPRELNLLFAVAVVLFIKSARKVMLFLLNQVRDFLRLLPGNKTKALLARYLNMARFALYEKQSGIYSKLNRQYPEGSHFILLPMDMAYMGAGKVKNTYLNQMEALVSLNKKEEAHPFVFIDPRRIREEGKAFLNFSFNEGTIRLENSFVKRFIEEEEFAGFKIYPALGYFPFDEALLPLWKYAADNGYPIMTHGIKGIIYYRGAIKKEWNTHPVFTEYLGDQQGHQPLFFSQFKNDDFQTNFTHPMNFLCLLEEPLLRKLIGEGKSEENKAIFGYTNADTPLKYNLSQLKVCFAHYGGEGEWNRFLERDRDNYAQQLMAKPDSGIYFGADENGEMPWGRYETVWKYADWYSIVSSMMIQYDNFYADISYIVSNPHLYPMLRSTISPASTFENYFTEILTYESRNKLRSRVLFGSDFYVVRSQKSDKDIFIELKAYLTQAEFDLIARENPHNYLYHH